MTDPGLLYIIGGTTIVLLLTFALILAAVWLTRRIDGKSGLYPPAGWCETCRTRVPDLAKHLERNHPGFDPQGGNVSPDRLIGWIVALVFVLLLIYVVTRIV